MQITYKVKQENAFDRGLFTTHRSNYLSYPISNVCELV